MPSLEKQAPRFDRLLLCCDERACIEKSPLHAQVSVSPFPWLCRGLTVQNMRSGRGLSDIWLLEEAELVVIMVSKDTNAAVNFAKNDNCITDNQHEWSTMDLES